MKLGRPVRLVSGESNPTGPSNRQTQSVGRGLMSNPVYHNGFQNGALPAFPLVLGTTKSHRGTGQGSMGDDLRHRAQILSDIPVP